MKKVLIIDDEPAHGHLAERKLSAYKDKVSIIPATTVEGGRSLFEENNDPDLIAVFMDGNLGAGGTINDTIKLIEEIRLSGYKGMLFSTTGLEEAEIAHLKAGCTAHVDKLLISDTIKTLLLRE